MVRIGFTVASSLVVAACGFSPMLSSDDTVDGNRPRVCDPLAPPTCKDAQTVSACSSDGSAVVETACPLGCAGSPAHCHGVVPSNGVPVSALTAADGTLDTGTTGSLIVDTGTGEIVTTGPTMVRAAGMGYDPASKIAFAVVTQSGAPSIGVLSFARLRIAPNTQIRARGPNALALVASGTIEVDGLLDLTGGIEACTDPGSVTDIAQCAGPGGSAGGGPDQAAMGSGAGGYGSGGPSGFAESGGGGGGHATAGAIGGTGTTFNTTVGTPGPAFGSDTLTPLVGGGGGGGGGDEPQASTKGATGGGGGGAVQITSNTSIVVGPGTTCGINAGGGGAGTSFLSSGGGGGGAGGGVLLEAPMVMLGGGCMLAANGGGGSGATGGARGTTGLLATAVAAGSIEGSGGTRSAGNGGAGGALDVAPVKGGDGNDEAGGGGGATGFVHVKSSSGTSFTNAGATSPAAGQSAVVLD